VRPLTENRSLSARPVVAHVRVVTGAGGGPDKTILNSPRFLAPFGYETVCAYMHPPGDLGFEQLRAKASTLDAVLVSVPDYGPLDITVVPRLWHLCRRHKVSIWHGHDYNSNILGLILRRMWPMKLVTTVHGWVSTSGRSPLYSRIDRWSLRYYERIICVSSDLQQQCFAAGVSPNRCTLIDNAIDTGLYHKASDLQAAKLRIGSSSNRLMVGAVGRLAPEKAFDQLIVAADRVMQTGLDFELVIVGDGDERNRLESLIAKLDRADRIRLVGYQSDLLDY